MVISSLFVHTNGKELTAHAACELCFIEDNNPIKQ